MEALQKEIDGQAFTMTTPARWINWASSETDSDSINIPERGGHGAVGHVPVLLQEAIDFLAVKRWRTLSGLHGGAGRAFVRNRKTPRRRGHLIGFDKDAAAWQEQLSVVSCQLSVKARRDWLRGGRARTPVARLVPAIGLRSR